ncbi:uncharacterized protein LOC142338169 [Convolutriloba macropyga]|uniref:uncharacterized protein LOC142338169 n=1 Tax=Convolutriloba macropyga TaxID=536237 RepID=UPI003F51B5CD
MKALKYYNTKEDRRAKDDSSDFASTIVPVIKVQKELIRSLSAAYPDHESYQCNISLTEKIFDLIIDFVHKCGDKTGVKTALDSLEQILMKVRLPQTSEDEKGDNMSLWINLTQKLVAAYPAVITTDSLRVSMLSLTGQILTKTEIGHSLSEELRSALASIVDSLESSHKHHAAIVQHIQVIRKSIAN